SAQVALPGGNLSIPMDLALAMRTPRDQVVSIDMSYNTHMPFNDYLVIGQEATLLVTAQELRDPERLLVERAEDDPIARQDAEFFGAFKKAASRPSPAERCGPPWRRYRQRRI